LRGGRSNRLLSERIVGFSQPNPSDRLPSDQRGKPTYRAFLRKLTHCTVPGLTNDRFGLPAPPIIMVKAFLRPGLPVMRP
jgi:hypothetical protein